jgi:4'-phosphopantetheinyl transferase
MLATDSIQVHSVFLDAEDSVIARFEAVLSPEERDRQARFRFERLRRDFAVAHGVLRTLLAHYVGCAPELLRFSQGPKGKPSIAEPASDVRFNMSHSGRIAVFAFARGQKSALQLGPELGPQLGIDVEQIRPMDDLHSIANRFFCADEVADLLSLPPEVQELGFFHCWTRKEAYIKAIGDGLSLPLDSFRVTFLPGETPTLTGVAPPWNLHHLDIAEGYVAALAYRGGRKFVYVVPATEAGHLSLE